MEDIKKENMHILYIYLKNKWRRKSEKKNKYPENPGILEDFHL